MFYLDDHNPNPTLVESEHERQQRRISTAEANSFAVDNRPPIPFAGLTTYQNGWLIKGFAHAGVEVDERKKDMAEKLLNMLGGVRQTDRQTDRQAAAALSARYTCLRLCCMCAPPSCLHYCTLSRGCCCMYA